MDSLSAETNASNIAGSNEELSVENFMKLADLGSRKVFNMTIEELDNRLTSVGKPLSASQLRSLFMGGLAEVALAAKSLDTKSNAKTAE